MKPLKLSLLLVFMVSLVVWVLYFLAANEENKTRFPWQVSVNPAGHLQVFGLTLEETTILQAKEILNANPKLALIESTDGSLSLELDLGENTFGLISGRLLAEIDVDEATKKRLKANNVKAKKLESGSIKMSLAHEDAIKMINLPLVGLSFIPYGDFSAEKIRHFFGQPSKVISETENSLHFLYPEKGIGIMLNRQGKEVFQYISPAKFSRLEQPLMRLSHKNR